MRYLGAIVVVIIVLSITYRVRTLNKHVAQIRPMIEFRDTSNLKVSTQAQIALCAIFHEQITTNTALLCLRLLDCLGEDNRIELEEFSKSTVKLKFPPNGSMVFRFDDKKTEYILESFKPSTNSDFDYSSFCP